MLGHTPRKTAKHRENVKGLHRFQSNETGTSFPYSPDLTPSDFFLFGSVKGKLTGYRAETPCELLVRIRIILAEISRDTLNAVFLNRWSDCKNACR
jgi:hypothetical protein